MQNNTFEEAYKTLNSGQKAAVDAIEGPVMVVAGPGTGKTTILTLRIANILKETDIEPENILALTFTNSGVHAMRKKLLEYIGDDAYRVGIFTFHSFAENIIKEFSFYFKSLEFSQVITNLEKTSVLEVILEKGSFKEIVSKHDVFSLLSQVKKAIDDIKQEGLSPEVFKERIPDWEKELLGDENIFYKKNFGKYKTGDIKPAEKEKVEKKIAKACEIATVFEKYQEKLEEMGRYDFSDMILNVLCELEQNENLKLDLQEQYQYVLVDEHQDTNDGQNKLIELLTDAEHLDGNPNLFTVGDEKQSIYRFQGASEKTFTHFHELFPDAKIIHLKDNYRSTQDILDGAQSLIQKTVTDTVTLKSHAKEGIPIHYAEFSNHKFELLHLAEDIKSKIDPLDSARGRKEKVDPKEIAVIYRSNKNVEDIKTIFVQKGIPFTILSKEYLLEDIHIENLITLLRVIYNPKDNHALGKALFIDFLNFDVYEVVEVLGQFRKQRSGALFDLLQKKKNKEYVDFIEKIKALKVRSENTSFSSFFKLFLEDSGYLEYMLHTSDNRQQLLKIDKLFDEIKRQIAAKNKSKKGYGLHDFLYFIDSYQKYNLDIETNDPEVIEGVKLITAHKSKGLEFEHVYIIGAARKNWEKSRGFASIALPIDSYKGGEHDERRLFYVAMTRAKKELAITNALTDWEGKEQEKSQFVSEIQEDFIKKIDTETFEKEHIEQLTDFLKNAKNNEAKSIWNKEYLRKLFLERNVSVTALNNYLDCPIKYLFRNLIQLPSEYSANLMYGDVVHNSLENFFEECREKEKILNKKDLINYFNTHINQSSFYGAEYDRYKERGEQVLGEYYDQYHKDWVTDIENEKYIKRDFELDSGESIQLSGRIDKVEFLDSKVEGKIRIIDYKTGKPFSDKSKKQDKEDLKRQLIFYHLLYEDYAKNAFQIEKAILDFIEKNKKGEYEQYAIEVTNADIASVKKEINQMAQGVLSGLFLKKGCGKQDCQYCKLLSVTS